MKNEELNFSIIRRPKVILTSKNIDYFPKEVKMLLDDFSDIIVDEFLNALPPIKSISHHAYLILGASFPNKAT